MTSPESAATVLTEADAIAALKALKVVLSADALTRPEIIALAAARVALPVSDAGFDAVTGFDPRGASFAELLPKLPRPVALRWLHLAITGCWADDNYSLQERAAVTRAAEHLGLAGPMQRSFEALVEMERQVAALRAALLEL